ncbi:MAG TPA: transposase [Candidatus Nitrosocosmicus sp.]
MKRIPWPTAPTTKKLGRPYVYSPTVILRCFIVRIWFRIDSNNALHTFLIMDCLYNSKLAIACGLIKIPSRRTFDRRIKTISTDIKERISTMGHLFVTKGMADPSITAVDSTLLNAKGSVWHKSSMKKGVVPCSAGIDSDAKWGYSHTKGWIFGYKLHLTCTTGDCSTSNSRCNYCKCAGQPDICSFNFIIIICILFTICLVYGS